MNKYFVIKPFVSFLILFGLVASSMAQYGPNNPTGSSTDDTDVGAGSNQWTGTTDAYTQDDIPAAYSGNNNFDNNDVSDVLRVTGFGFNIPANCNILGVVVEMDKYKIAGSAKDATVSLIDDASNIVGNNKATAAAYTAADIDSYDSYGGILDTWGLALTPAIVNSANFGVAFQTQATSNNTRVRVDHIQVTIYSDCGTYTTASLALSNTLVNNTSNYTFTQTTPNDGTALDYSISAGASVTVTIPNGSLATATVAGSTFNGQAIASFSTQTASTLVFTVPAGGGVAENTAFDIVIAGVTNYSLGGTYSTATVSAVNGEGGVDYYNTYSYTLTEPGCGAGGGENSTITANTYTSICPGTTQNVTWTITENATSTIPGGSTGNIQFSFPLATDFQFTGNVTITWNTAGDLDVSNNLISSPSISMTDAYTLDVYNLATKSGGGGQNQLDYITVVAEVLGVGMGTDVIERCGGSFTTNFINDGTNVATLITQSMSYVTTVVTQATVDDVPPNSINNEILAFNVSTTGACSPLAVSELVWTTTGTTDEADISNSTIFYTGSNSIYSSIGSFDTQILPTGTVTMTGSQTLGAGDNYFWLAYDLPTTAVSSNFVDATAVSVTVGGTSYDITSDPAGNREIGAFFTTTATDVWSNSGTTWNLTGCDIAATAGTPGSGTNAVVCDLKTVTLTGAAQVKNLVVDGIINLGANDLTVYGNLNFVSGTINATTGNLILVGANKIISGDGLINFTGGGKLVIEEDISIDAAATITVTSNNISINSSGKTLTNNGTLIAPGFIGIGSGPTSTPENFINATGAYIKFTGSAPWNNQVQVDFDNGSNTVEFAASHTLVVNKAPQNSTFWHLVISGGTLVIPNASFYIKGNFTNNSAIDAVTNAPNTFTFNGASPQILGGTSSTTFDNIVFNNANGFTLGNNISAVGAITLTSGVITTGVNALYHNNVTATDLTRTSGYVYGTLIRDVTGSATYMFPISKGTAGTDYHQADVITSGFSTTVTLTSSVNSITEVGNEIDARIVASEDGTAFDNMVETAQWTITPDVQPGAGSYGVRLYVANLPGLADNKFAILKRPELSTDYVDWASFDATTTIPATGAAGRTVASGYAEKLGFTSFSKFGVGSAPGVLPIELVSFEANLNGHQVDLKWVTETEINNDYFTIEKSKNGKDFIEVFKVYGAGNSSTRIEYVDVDYDLWEGRTYYRLKQTDYDGKFSYSNIVAVVYKGEDNQTVPSEVNMNIYPNPSDGTNVHIDITGFDPDKEILVVVRDITGKEFYSKVLVSDYNGQLATVIDPYEQLPAGTYLVTGSADDRLFSKKLLVLNNK